MIDPVGTVHESCVLGREDAKRDAFCRSSANSRRLLCEEVETTREYWLPRQSLSRPSSSPALVDAQSRWNQPGRPRRSNLAARTRPRIFPRSILCSPRGKTEKVVQAAKFDPLWASRADSSGSGHLPEQENTMGDSGSDAGASIHASFRNLHRAAAGSLRTIK